MAFTYSGDPKSSLRDYIRFKIQDTDSTAPILLDAEIDCIISEASTLTGQLALAFRQCATTYAKYIKRQLGPQSEDPTERSKYFRDMAKKYEGLLTYSGVPPLPSYEADPIFGKNMMANETG